jgi:hypothetical protein
MLFTSFHDPNRPDGMRFGGCLTRRMAQEAAAKVQASDRVVALFTHGRTRSEEKTTRRANGQTLPSPHLG